MGNPLNDIIKWIGFFLCVFVGIALLLDLLECTWWIWPKIAAVVAGAILIKKGNNGYFK